MTALSSTGLMTALGNPERDNRCASARSKSRSNLKVTSYPCTLIISSYSIHHPRMAIRLRSPTPNHLPCIPVLVLVLRIHRNSYQFDADAACYKESVSIIELCDCPSYLNDICDNMLLLNRFRFFNRRNFDDFKPFNGCQFFLLLQTSCK